MRLLFQGADPYPFKQLEGRVQHVGRGRSYLCSVRPSKWSQITQRWIAKLVQHNVAKLEFRKCDQRKTCETSLHSHVRRGDVVRCTTGIPSDGCGHQ
ncbi:hypothetical protein SERLADRAFT_378092 [Serpula lacrymans var. lacrymans S7.9]|uniref:Uncharacterized protein n=1 Tax=Serpula lacrymans var. lacrymans (strain S7.9) TaxID=578457 RepID=F8NGH2_SERL9|nr:uncharacterized protein SERLADRAFT_378092 [Serpula lacrymans var. lacrymans S7.9]EGO29359.1 hypothetical protein SERLADRAFT_378092 [Serpula lacrymans var. lacrymans S7.9]